MLAATNLYKTACPDCGEPTDGLMSGNIFYTKLPSGQTIYVQHNEKHQARNFLVKSKVLSEFVNLDWIPVAANERVPGKTRCEECEKHQNHIQAMQQEVEAGGVAWRCEECGNTGVVTADYLYAQKVRKESGIEPPEMCALSFPECELHREIGIDKCTTCETVTMLFAESQCEDCYDSNEE